MDLSRLKETRPFHFKRGTTGCLLVHGLTSTPFTVRSMGEWLARHGITVYAPLLAGHGRTWRELEKSGWKDWYGSVEAGCDFLRARCRRVFAAGISMGGAQVLHLAEHHPELDGVVAMAPACYITDWRLKILPLLRLVQRTVPAIGGAIADPSSPPEICNDRLPLRSVAELLGFQSHFTEDLHLIRCPALLVQGRNDPVVPFGNAKFAYDRISSKRKKLLILPKSSHVITMDWEKERLFRLALKLMKE